MGLDIDKDYSFELGYLYGECSGLVFLLNRIGVKCSIETVERYLKSERDERDSLRMMCENLKVYIGELGKREAKIRSEMETSELFL